MASNTIKSTKNYRLFARSAENRPLDEKRHKALYHSMQTYSFLRSFPIVCQRNGGKHLIVKDGQHRLMIAESLDLPVHYIVEDVDFDIAVVNSTAKTWTLKDYAQKHAANRKKAYAEALEFSEQHGIPLVSTFALLGGTTTFSNIRNAVLAGLFKIKDRAWANQVALVYVPLSTMEKKLKSARFLEACMAVCRVPEFDANRLIKSADKCRDKLVSYSTRDAFLDMLESVYNFKRHNLVGLKAAAIMAMRKRNATGKGKK